MLYLIGIVAFLADRILKLIALSFVLQERVVLIQNFFSFRFYKNFGAAFSLKIPVEIIVLLSLVVLLGVGYHAVSPWFATKSKRQPLTCAQVSGEGYPTPRSIPRFVLFFLILGAASNIFDRLYYGYVVDYFSFFNYSFWNIADLMIIFSLGFVLYWYWKK